MDKKNVDFPCIASFELTKRVDISTNNYNDLNGKYVLPVKDENWASDYEKQHLNPLELIGKLKEFAQAELSTSDGFKTRQNYLRYIISECEFWELSNKYVDVM